MIMFKYIKNWYTLISDKLLKTDIIYISGESRTGKTSLAKNCMGCVSDNEYFKLYLKCYNNYNPSYGPFMLGLMKADAHYETCRELISDFLTSSENRKIKLLSEVITYGRTYREKRLSQLNDMELSVINRITFHCNGRSLFLIADDFGKWDEDSKNLLYFLMTQEAKSAIPFLKNAKIIITSENECLKNRIREFCPSIFSVNLTVYTQKAEFDEDLALINENLSESLKRTLFDVTKGNLGISSDILHYLGVENCNNNIDDIYNKEEYKTLFTNILSTRAFAINTEQPAFIQTIKAASVIGEVFNQIYLSEIIEENEFNIGRILSTAINNQFIDNYENTMYTYSFFDKIVFQFFDENFNEYKKEYHYKFAMAIKKLKPDDYYMQFHHLRASGKEYEAAETLVIYLIRREILGYFIDMQLVNYLKKQNDSLYQNYKIISSAIKAYNDGFFKDAKNQLEMITPNSELVMQEKDYLSAYFLYDFGNTHDFCEARMILEEHHNTLLEENFDIWLRSSILLYIFYVNRVHLDQEARNVEKKITKEVAKRYKYNPDLEITVQILNRNSGAIYSTEIALLKIDKSVEYFEKKASYMPKHYVMALTNYAGISIVASEYQKAFKYAQRGIDFLRNKKILLKDAEKTINNYLISGYFAGKVTCEEAVKSFELLFKDFSIKNKVLLLNNYYIFKLLHNELSNLYDQLENLFQAKAVQKHNDYYIYLTGINLICVALVLNQYQNAKKYFEKINKMVPSICSREEHYILMRYQVFEDIIYYNNTHFDNVYHLEKMFQKKMESCPYDYVKRPYILTDQQFWSFF
jgi:hypothetical protein